MQKALKAHAKRSEDSGRISALVKLAESEYIIAKNLAADLDNQPMLLAVQNGIIDLRTGQLRPAEREDLITKQCPVVFDETAECPTWEEFICDITLGDEELVQYLQMMAGYFLTGSNREQCIFILHGHGSNGKSTFVNVLQDLLGAYANQTPTEVLMMRKRSGADPEVARLKGTRLAVVAETDAGQQFSEVMLKQLTGGDKVVARHLYAEYIEFTPQHKIVMTANHLPMIRGTDHAIWRRIRVVPFDQVFTKQNLDAKLPEKLNAELSGILNWCLEGCKKWQMYDLGKSRCRAVAQITRGYQEDNDPVAVWLQARCVRDESTMAVLHNDELHASYTEWAKASGARFMNPQELGKILSSKGIKRARTSQGRGYVGIRFKTDKDAKAENAPDPHPELPI